jgi:Uma2 family endonuclease
LLQRLGDIPPERVRWQPRPGDATEADVLSEENKLCELVEGVLVEKAMGFREAILASLLATFLNEFVRPRHLGLVFGPDGTIRLWAGLVRIPDVAFVSWDRLPGRRVPDAPIPHLAPNLAVEVLSISNTRAEMARKRQEYFSAGVLLVWEADPRARTVAVYTSPTDVTILTEADVLDGGPVLPGFTLPLRDWFGELDQQG